MSLSTVAYSTIVITLGQSKLFYVNRIVLLVIHVSTLSHTWNTIKNHHEGFHHSSEVALTKYKNLNYYLRTPSYYTKFYEFKKYFYNSPCPHTVCPHVNSKYFYLISSNQLLMEIFEIKSVPGIRVGWVRNAVVIKVKVCRREYG